MGRQDEIDRGAVAAASLIVLAVFSLLTIGVAVLVGVVVVIRRLLG